LLGQKLIIDIHSHNIAIIPHFPSKLVIAIIDPRAVLRDHIVNNRIHSPLFVHHYFFRLVRYYAIVMRMSNIIHLVTLAAYP
jgi:hypothetical protein